jgi:hypothetical protein
MSAFIERSHEPLFGQRSLHRHRQVDADGSVPRASVQIGLVSQVNRGDGGDGEGLLDRLHRLAGAQAGKNGGHKQ